ncbi:NDP-hexose 2,3-dehydratase family protein [Streptomyces sp. Li-HN-5-11]|uniref:NDP-hexose 2,3-dehydratase family protein n=1 Tax=Streptomyces sp. Li-HN-5-11 TaxID=3075432 RepID=UPI0028AED1F3|nr:NDP-hexose 2,3-dehydratase family protein [Streptomyces sp. Li-HN-5-11]WNM31362.1 NDP-hexose 2,3-dehydratase family protein [Streptomyces sp. Li-HN-5-11]
MLSTVSNPIHLRLARSALRAGDPAALVPDVRGWLADFGRRAYTRVERIPLDRLEGWTEDPGTGDIRHETGRFFAIEGLRVRGFGGPVTGWDQPIINQPEIGILGILAKEFDGTLKFLMQAKVEPGNRNGLQLSPTVQATRSNYTRVHRGRAVPYLDYFRHTGGHRVLADVRQSEQGSWFYRKRNRNMVVEPAGDVEVLDGFRWLTLGEIHALLGADDLINMDARTVLSCLPFAGPGLDAVLGRRGDTEFRAALVQSCSPEAGSLHSTREVLSWLTEARCRSDAQISRIPLREVDGWVRAEDRIAHEDGLFFSVIGVRVGAGGREVAQWTQPMIEPNGTGVIAFLVKDIGGVLHVLMNARTEPGFADTAELGPTVQCIPENHALLPRSARPRFLDEVVSAEPGRVRFATLLSEEGGRFYHALNRYLVVEADPGTAPDDPDFRWVAVHQLVSLLMHSHCLSVQARSLVACLHSLLTGEAGAREARTGPAGSAGIRG